MQGLVYIFIALAALGVAATAYFGLTFTPIEAFVVALVFACLATLLLERSLRRRAEARLERAIEDLARLLSTDAQAGAVLSQRINALADADAGSRLDAIEADVSVLGTVVRQVAEVVAEQEEAWRSAAGSEPAAPAPAVAAPPDDDGFPEPVIPAEQLREALADNRMIHHVEPVLMLPQRRPYGYDVISRLRLEDDTLADPPDFMPRRGHADLVRRIEALALEDAIDIARRAHAAGRPIRLFTALTRATLGDAASFDQLLAILDAHRAIAGSLTFTFSHADWKQLLPDEKAQLAQIGHRVAFSLTGASGLRFDFGELEGLGFASVRFDATRFLRNPEIFTDFHVSDIAAYSKRFRIALVATGIIDEQQLLTLFESDITMMQGPHISGPGPVPADLLVEQQPPEPQRAKA